MSILDKIAAGKKKVDKFQAETNHARRVTPLPVMILNDSLTLLVIVAYILMGVLGDNLWHPGWLIFFLIPTYYMMASCIVHRSPYLFPITFLVVGAYLLLGFVGGNEYWHPYWAILFIIPLYYMTVGAIKNGNVAKIFDFLVPVLVVGIYLVIGFCAKAWHPGWVVFFAIPLYYQVKGTFRRYAGIKKYDEAREKKEQASESEDTIDGEIN